MNKDVQPIDNSIRVLLVDDDHQQFLLIGYILSEIATTDYRLIWCDDLEKALIHIEHQQCDVVLLDYHWAQSGQMFIKRAQQLPHRIPIILMTDGMESEVDRIAIRSGASDYLVKDKVNSELLERAIRYSIERKKVEQHLDYLAHYDFLTGLPNRLLFKDRLNQAIHISQRAKKHFTLMYIDLNDFKNINDKYGHNVGDLLLKEFALRLTGAVRRSDTVARIGGDEFTIILNDMGSIPKIISIVQKLLERVAEPFILQSNKFEAGCSIGIATYPDMGSCAESLQRNADMAMYQAKKTGVSSYQFFSVSDKSDLPIKVADITDIQKVISNKTLSLVYQPRIDIETGKVKAIFIDIMCRQDSVCERLYSKFVKLMNNHDAILYLARWMISESLTNISGLCRQYNVKLVYPVTSMTIASNKFCSGIKNELVSHNLTIDDVEFIKINPAEVEGRDNSKQCIDNANELGAQFVLDISGENMLNLSDLHNYNVSSFYISSMLLDSMNDHAKNLNLLEGIAALAKKINANIIADNVSTATELHMMKKLGCNQAQGNFLVKMIGLEDLLSFLEQRNATKNTEYLLEER